MCTEEVLPYVVRIIHYSFLCTSKTSVPFNDRLLRHCRLPTCRGSVFHWCSSGRIYFRFRTSLRLCMAVLALLFFLGSLRRGGFCIGGSEIMGGELFLSSSSSPCSCFSSGQFVPCFVSFAQAKYSFSSNLCF